MRRCAAWVRAPAIAPAPRVRGTAINAGRHLERHFRGDGLGRVLGPIDAAGGQEFPDGRNYPSQHHGLAEQVAGANPPLPRGCAADAAASGDYCGSLERGRSYGGGAILFVCKYLH